MPDPDYPNYDPSTMAPRTDAEAQRRAEYEAGLNGEPAPQVPRPATPAPRYATIAEAKAAADAAHTNPIARAAALLQGASTVAPPAPAVDLPPGFTGDDAIAVATYEQLEATDPIRAAAFLLANRGRLYRNGQRLRTTKK